MPVNPKSEKTPPSALAVRQQQPTFYVEGDETSADSCDSGIERVRCQSHFYFHNSLNRSLCIFQTLFKNVHVINQ